MEVSPVVKERPQRVRNGPNYEYFEFEYQVKQSSSKIINHLIIISREEDELDGENLEDSFVDASANKVSIDSQVKLKRMDQKSIKSKDSKKIKHKTPCKVCQEQFLSRQILLDHDKATGHYVKFRAKA